MTSTAKRVDSGVSTKGTEAKIVWGWVKKILGKEDHRRGKRTKDIDKESIDLK